jgi:hypothetical protein
VEWLTFIRPAGALLTGIMSIYDRARGKLPTADFAAGDFGVVLHLRNDRGETIIVERVDATPPLLAFSTTHEVEDIANAIVQMQEHSAEDALAVLRPKEEVELKVIEMGSFKSAPADQKIKVTLRWRASSRSLLSRSTVSKAITVQDVRDLERASEKRRGRPLWTSVHL